MPVVREKASKTKPNEEKKQNNEDRLIGTTAREAEFTHGRTYHKTGACTVILEFD